MDRFVIARLDKVKAWQSTNILAINRLAITAQKLAVVDFLDKNALFNP